MHEVCACTAGHHFCVCCVDGDLTWWSNSWPGSCWLCHGCHVISGDSHAGVFFAAPLHIELSWINQQYLVGGVYHVKPFRVSCLPLLCAQACLTCNSVTCLVSSFSKQLMSRVACLKECCDPAAGLQDWAHHHEQPPVHVHRADCRRIDGCALPVQPPAHCERAVTACPAYLVGM